MLPVSRVIQPKDRIKARLRIAAQLAASPLCLGSLSKMAIHYGTDKNGAHYYTQHYESHFASYRWKPVTVLEIGIGGYDWPHLGGDSLRLWRSYFPFGSINGIDIYDKKFHQNCLLGIRTFQGSQDDPEFLAGVIERIGNPHIIIDDGSHEPTQTMRTFELLFPYLRVGGMYVIEDLQTSYFPGASMSSVDALKSLIDGLNHVEQPDWLPTSLGFEKLIRSIHFYHNICFIAKDHNVDRSNLA
jgi:hypothetical protein